MANKWTDEQLNAITERGCNLLVAAAAGAGKTAVLVERIIRKITDSENSVDVDRLLVVTFTNAAATEMRERIGNALADALEAEPSSANLQKQMALLDRASIMTLHSFCLEVVRSNFHSLDLDPLFRIADETEATLMRLDALEQLFEEKYENEDKGSAFFQLVDSYGGGRDDSSLRNIVMALHRFISSHPWPEDWLAKQVEDYGTGVSACLSSNPWVCVLLKSATADLQGLIAMLGRAAALASHGEGLEPYCGVLDEDMRMVKNLLSVCQEVLSRAEESMNELGTQSEDTQKTSLSFNDAWDKLSEAFSSFKPSRLPRCGKDVDIAAQDEVKAARNAMKEHIKKLYSNGFDSSSADIAEDLSKLYPLLKCLSDMVLSYDAIYQQKKRDKGLLDFNDLEHYCLKVLLKDKLPTSAAKEIRERYEEILVDEYQDSNLIQELILETVSGNQDDIYNIFMVGDVKQSIYRFRQARPELFMDKYNSYHREHGFDNRVIKLYKNFRSRPEVINAVNFIFKQIMSFDVGELDYTESEYLNPGAIFPEPQENCSVGGTIELHVLDLTAKECEINLPSFTDTQSTVNDSDRIGESGAVVAGLSLETAEDSTAARGAAAITADGNTAARGAGAITADGNTAARGAAAITATGDDDVDSLDEEYLDNIQYEARLVGKRIKELITYKQDGFNVYDKKLGKYRPAEYRDIVILMRTTKNWADVFSDELALMGIPSYADAGLGYFRTVEVETTLSLLQIIDNPLQDIPMLAVLRSPIGGFSTDELADIRLTDRSVSIYEAMMKLINLSEAKLRDNQYAEAFVKKTRKFVADLHNWRDIAQYTSTDELVWQLLIETGYYSYAGILPGGVERQANLRILFERARQYEETSYRGLFNFINFINRLRSGGGDMGSAKILGENDNVVRIMSIHKSKGLEFPVVIVAGCGKKFNIQDLNASILLHQDLGLGPDIVDLKKRTITPSLPKMAIRQKLRLETLSEEMRILYVAFTRAREKLIITGCVRNIERQCTMWCSNASETGDKLPTYNMMQASNYLDWIGAAVARHSSANVIRHIAGVGNSIIEDEKTKLEVRLWGTGVSSVNTDIPEAALSIRDWLDADRTDELEEQKQEVGTFLKALEWEYPYEFLSSIPAKVSVTELKRRFMQEEFNESATPFIQPMIERPLFMEPERGLSAAHKGTVMHFVMQHLDLGKLSGINSDMDMLQEIRSQLISMKDKELLTQAEAESVRLKAIATFFTTSVGKLMLTMHESIHRETAFNIEIKSSEVYGGMAKKGASKESLPDEDLSKEDMFDKETMLLQGVIDCWFETNEGLLLLDYKTDFVPPDGSELIRQRYKVQIDYYTKALERITGKRVNERYLYLFYNGELLKC